MSFPRYKSYTSSNIEWLGEIPSDWTTCRFSRVIAAIKDGTHGTFQRVAEGWPLLSAKNVQNGWLDISEAESLISNSDYEEIVSNGFPRAGDLLLTIVGTIGRACVYTMAKPIAFQRSVCFIRLTPHHEPQFFYYLSQSAFFQEQLVSRSKSAAQGGVYMGDLVACAVLYPRNQAEQSAIAAFLDHETAKIDALVDEQTRLIELLREKRQAVISHTVSQMVAEQHAVPLNDRTVLMSINGTIGNLALYRGERVMLGKSAAYINCTDQIDRNFLLYFLQSTPAKGYFELNLTGTTISMSSGSEMHPRIGAWPNCPG